MIEEDARAQIARLPGWTRTVQAKLEQFVSALQDENERQNLVSPATMASVWERHILDSAQLVRHVPRETLSWLDLGSGAGLPGLVAAIMLPGTSFTLVEARRLRADWLRRMADALSLRNLTIFAGKLEAMPATTVNAISARAFAPLDRLLELASRFSTERTLWLLPKGRSAAQELSELRGWVHSLRVEPSLTDPASGIIIGTLRGRKGGQL